MAKTPIVKREAKQRNAGKNIRRRVGSDGLTARERHFVSAYVQTLMETQGKGNAKRAALLMGATEATAASMGSGLLRRPQVQAAIQPHIERFCEKYDVTTERIVRELAKLAFTGMSKFARKTDDGQLYFDFSTATDDELDAIVELTVDEYQEGKASDDTQRNVKKVKFKLDRKGALELLGRHHKMFTDNVAHCNPDGSPIEPADDEIIVIFSDPPAEPAKPKE